MVPRTCNWNHVFRISTKITSLWIWPFQKTFPTCEFGLITLGNFRSIGISISLNTDCIFQDSHKTSHSPYSSYNVSLTVLLVREGVVRRRFSIFFSNLGVTIAELTLYASWDLIITPSFHLVLSWNTATMLRVDDSLWKGPMCKGNEAPGPHLGWDSALTCQLHVCPLGNKTFSQK